MIENKKEEVKEDVLNLKDDEYLDFSKMQISDEVKKEFINMVTASCSKELLKAFFSCGLKTHIEQMIVDGVSGKEFVLSFQTLETFQSRLKVPPNNLVNEESQDILIEALESIAESKYPESIFTMTDKDFEKVKWSLEGRGYNIDAISGYYGRIFQKIFIDQAKEALEKHKSISKK